ncbi:ferredoxin-type protein NapH [Saccharicrinis carchari]|uniref:Ferredoxin-type protein NapH n=1 Tax=Saccharicrinis carchari TaxID=1168039 RepID=A0A521F3S1_SACCC|nr:quinol dehydrogenase ferredoxin subunit NapH [Saccharicrinis carchari]SMO90251.1 ferredoxin-type protein NapH [Saccharicrinis carchari]
MGVLKKYRFLIGRRTTQLVLLGLFVGANYLGWNILRGNFSSALLFDTVPLADPYAVVQVLASGFMASAELLLGAAIILLVYGILFGRMFCSWVCPMNIVEDFATWIHNKLGLKSSLSISRKARYWVLGLGIVLSIILGYAAFEAVSPISILHRGAIFGMGAGWAIVLAVFLFDLSLTKFGWCGHLCPLGVFYALISKYALIKVYHNKDNCTQCMKCFAVCPEKQVLRIVTKKSGIIKPSECTNCARCIEVCQDNALNLSLRTIKK